MAFSDIKYTPWKPQGQRKGQLSSPSIRLSTTPWLSIEVGSEQFVIWDSRSLTNTTDELEIWEMSWRFREFELMRLTPFSSSGVYGTYLKVPSGIFSPTLIVIVKMVYVFVSCWTSTSTTSTKQTVLLPMPSTLAGLSTIMIHIQLLCQHMHQSAQVLNQSSILLR